MQWGSASNVSALVPATYQNQVNALIAIIQAGEAYFSAQGIVPPIAGESIYGYVYANDYGTTQTALTVADAIAVASGKTVLVQRAFSVTGSISMSAPVQVIGGSFTGNGTITFNGGFVCAPVSCFASTLTVVFGDTAPVQYVKPEWFGALGDGVTFTATASIGSTTVGGSGFTQSMVGKPIVILDQSVSGTKFISTVASVTNSSSLEMAAPSTIALTPGQGVIASDSQVAIRAAFVATRGIHWLQFEPNIYGLGAPFYTVHPTGRGARIMFNGCTLTAVAVIASIMTSDPGANVSVNAPKVKFIGPLILDGANCAVVGWETQNTAFPAQLAGWNGTVSDVLATRVTGKGFKFYACQESLFSYLRTLLTGDNGLESVACNGSSFISTTIASSGNDGWYADSSALGGGDIFAYGTTLETITGYGVHVGAATANPGTGVFFKLGHMEGIGKDGFWIEREFVNVEGFSIAGAGAFSPCHIGSGAHGANVKCITWSGFASGATVLDSGVTNCIVEPNYNATTNAFTDPSVADGWAAKVQLRYATGDVQGQGKLYVGGSSTVSPVNDATEVIQARTGSAMLDKGNVMLALGSVSNEYGGIGLGVNGLLYPEEFDNGVWTVNSVAVTANQVEAPYQGAAGTLADRLVGSAAGAYIRQNVLATSMGGLTVNGSTFIFSVWVKARTTATTMRLLLENTVAGVAGSGTAFQDTYVTTEWKRIYVAFTSANNLADGIRVNIENTANNWDVYCWGAQLEFYSAGYGLDQRKPGPWAKTRTVARQIASNGPVFNTPPVLPGGTAVGVNASTDITITDARLTATSMIQLFATNAAGQTQIANGYFIQARSAGSQTLRTGVAGAGTETYDYVIVEKWAI
jgi:hypothetical protein